MLMNECFPNDWKKANIIPFYKTGDKHLIKKCVTPQTSSPVIHL